MNRPDPQPDLPASIERAAGGWLARRDRGLSPAEEADFTRWLETDPQHRQAVANLTRTFVAFDRIRDLAPAGVEDRAPDPDVFAPPRRLPFHPGWSVATLAAAAAIAVILFRPAPPAPQNANREFTAGQAAERITLADGSTVDLNRGTALTVELTASERRVHLTRGEAHFQVARDPSRPFVVDAAGVAAQAIGTAFTVRLTPGAVEVTVTEGRVQLAPPGASSAAPGRAPATALLAAGDHAVVSLAPSAPAPVVAALDATALGQRLAWQPRIVDLHKAPLAEVVAQFNQFAASAGQPRLELDDSSLGALRVGGSVRLDQPDAFARLLERSFGLRVRRDGDVIVLQRAPF